MKYLRRFAVLVLPVLTALSLCGSANAVPTGSQSPGANDGVSASRPTSSAPAALSSYISNQGFLGVGVIYEGDGKYVHGKYDAILHPGQRTDTNLGWDRAAGFYLGFGSCTGLWVYQHGEWVGTGRWYAGEQWVWLPDWATNPDRFEIRPYYC